MLTFLSTSGPTILTTLSASDCLHRIQARENASADDAFFFLTGEPFSSLICTQAHALGVLSNSLECDAFCTHFPLRNRSSNIVRQQEVLASIATRSDAARLRRCYFVLHSLAEYANNAINYVKRPKNVYERSIWGG